MSRAPLPYNPRNLGKMEDATVCAVAGSPACGDMIAIYLKITEGDVIEKAAFESYGCAANIATASITTELVKGRKLEEAWKISWKKVADEVGGLPNVKIHCGMLSVGAVRRAIRKFFEKKGGSPNWLPDELSSEERHALEEEELARAMSKKIGGK